MYEDIETELSTPNAQRVVESLRDTGYSFNNAVADIVDNSIAAGATKIFVKLDFSPIDNQLFLYVSDNGIGMDRKGLVEALRYGSPKRKNEKSLGKFGMGLKTASTAFCRCVSVISRDKPNGEVNKVVLDLDYINECNEWNLLLPKPTYDEIEILNEAAGNGPGTVVTWTKIDRLLTSKASGKVAQNAVGKISGKLLPHLSAIYHRFLDSTDDRAENVSIYLNDDPVVPWDPFCKEEKQTKVVAEKQLDVMDINDNLIASASIKAYVLPRKNQFSSPEAFKRAIGNDTKDEKGFSDTQGLYIYRENRLIQSGGWLSMFVKEPHFSLSRIEFSFDHTLDDAFKIDIKKSRITLDPDVKDVLKVFLNGPRRAAVERYRSLEEERLKAGTVGIHSDSNQTINNKATAAGVTQVTSVDKEHGVVTVTNMDPQPVPHKIEIRNSANPQQTRVIPVESINDGLLWEPAFVDENIAVKINEGHDFYKKIYYPNRKIGNLILGLDTLLWSLADAELGTSDSASIKRYEEMRYAVSRKLRKLLEDVPEPDSEE